MQIVIDIPEDRYKWIKQRVEENKNEPTHLPMEYVLIANGTPLPRGHGRLIDADKMKNKMLYSHDIGAEIEMNGTEEVINYIFNDAPTIIEADKEVEE